MALLPKFMGMPQALFVEYTVQEITTNCAFLEKSITELYFLKIAYYGVCISISSTTQQPC